MTSKAHVQFDPLMMGVKVAVIRDMGNQYRQALIWEPLVVKTYDVESAASEPDDNVWLRLPEEDARAIYEALGDHFGHAGHDIRALRKDYDAERSRVDKFIAHITKADR